jgi:hypothetical protein
VRNGTLNATILEDGFRTEPDIPDIYGGDFYA